MSNAMTVHFACDHAATTCKEALKEALATYCSEKGIDLSVIDHGTNTNDSCDYPVFAKALCEAVLKDGSRGILLCGTGIGMSMVANRYHGIRAALCTTELHARMARQHNNANVLCLGARMTGIELAKAILFTFLETPFEGGRHARRVALFD